MSASPNPQSVEKGGCLALALAVLGFGLWLIWPAPPVPVGSAGTPLVAASGRIEGAMPLGAPEQRLELTLRFTFNGTEYTAKVAGVPKSGANLKVGSSTKVLVDPADPLRLWVEALGQRPSEHRPAPTRTWIRVLGGLAAALGAFGLFLSLTGGGSRAPSKRPGEDDRH